MAKFRKKPVEIEAKCFTGGNHNALIEWGAEAGIRRAASGRLIIPTLEGDMTVSIGDWIIKGVQGEFYPCKPDIFEATYDPVP